MNVIYFPSTDMITADLACILLFLFGTGVSFVYIGVRGLLGYRRAGYLFPFRYGYVGGLVNYGAIPLGIMAIGWVIIIILPLPEHWEGYFFIISSLIGFLGVLLGVFQPRFMLPQWYRWLQENHKDILPLLREDVRRMGYKTWRRRTDTQESLEEWVAEVRWRHGRPER